MAESLFDESVFPAHIRRDGQLQSVEAHCRETAETAAAKLRHVGLGNTAYLAGLLHDSGKMTEAFRTYILKLLQGSLSNEGV